MNRKEIENIALDYLLKEDFPIVVNSCRVILSSDEEVLESKKFLEDYNFACVSFRSKHYDDPNNEYPCDPGIYIVYINVQTGEVYMPPIM